MRPRLTNVSAGLASLARIAAMQVNILEAKNQLSKLVQAALDGEDVIIARNGEPQVRLVKLGPASKRKAGSWGQLNTEAELEAAFSPEVDAEIARPYLQSLAKPIDPPRRKHTKPHVKSRRGA